MRSTILLCSIMHWLDYHILSKNMRQGENACSTKLSHDRHIVLNAYAADNQGKKKLKISQPNEDKNEYWTERHSQINV